MLKKLKNVMVKPLGPNASGGSQDDIDASKAPLMDHLIELRTRLIWALSAFLVAFLVCFAAARHIYAVLVWPYAWASGNDHVRLIATHFLEQIMTHVKLAMFGAGFIAFPIIAAQIYKFVAPGLYKNERKAFLPYLIATPILFCIGAAVVYFIAMPVLIKFSIGLAATTGDGPADNRADAQSVGISLADHDLDFWLWPCVSVAGYSDAAGARRDS